MITQDDPDWEAEAEMAAQEERRAEFLKNILAYHVKLQKAHILDVAKLPAGTRLITSCGNPDDPVEFTLLDPANGKVLVKDERNFREPAVGTLLGCEDVEAITPGTPYPCKRVVLPGKLKIQCWPIFEAGGMKYKACPNTLRRIEIFLPKKSEPYVLWQDD